MKKIALIIIFIGIFGFSVFAEAALFDRGGGLIYCDTLDITWLQDASYAQTSGFDEDGLMEWDSEWNPLYTAMAWADQLVYAGYSDWRLPSALNQDGSGPDYGNVADSEMGHLYYIELENTAGDGGFTNSGPFNNLKPETYWSGTGDLKTLFAWHFSFSDGYQSCDGIYNAFNAWAVRSGDSSPVPVPSAIVLLLSGIVGIIGIKSKI